MTQGPRLAPPLMIAGIALTYVMQLNPSPLLLEICDEFSLYGKDALLNMSVSIVFPLIVAGCLLGPALEKRTGTYFLYVAALAFVCAGTLLIMLHGGAYAVFLAGRAVFGFGFGLGVPFIGSAITNWFPPEKREPLNTLNSLFPFIGALACYLLTMPLYRLFGGSTGLGVGAWGVPLFAVLLLWLVCVRRGSLPKGGGESAERGMFFKLLRFREIRLVCATFICDFICYSYIGVILPTFLQEAGHMGAAAANICAAIAFPAVGLAGAVCGGFMISSGRRKPSLIIGQAGKLVGIIIAALFADVSAVFILLGTAVFGFSNGLWMPAMYCVPMDLEELPQSYVGAAFGLITAFGLAFGFIAPTVGGFLTGALSEVSGIASAAAKHAFGLKWSLFIMGFANLPALVCMCRIRETGGLAQR